MAAALPPEFPVTDSGELLVVAALDRDLEPFVVVEPLVLPEPDADSVVEAAIPCQI